MHDPDSFDEDASGTVFRDVILLALLGFVAIVVLLLPHVNPDAEDKEAGVSPASGNVVVEIHWPDGLNTDVDLWVQAPGDVPVGYSNKGGRIFNLLRDDLGHAADVTNENYEISYSRGIPEGEYLVNVHLYRNAARVYPVPVTVVTSVRPEGGELKQLLSTQVSLKRENEEITVYRFKLDREGALVPGSVHSLQRTIQKGLLLIQPVLPPKDDVP